MSLASQISALATRVATEFKAVRTEIAGRVPSTRTVAGKALSSDVTIAAGDLDATGTADSSTFLRGDGTWAAPTGAPDASTSTKGIVQLTNHLGGTATAPTVRTASTSQTGIVELATTAETTTGTDTARAVTPAGVKAVADTKAATSHTHAAADVTSGTLAIGRIPTGTTGSTVALGNHNHDSRYYTETEVNDLLAGKAPATQTINAKTGAYTLVASDAGKLVTMTVTTARNLTVPANVFTAGQRVDIADRGTARVTVVAGAGMTVNAPAGGSLVMEGRYSYASLVFISPTEADLVGLVAAS